MSLHWELGDDMPTTMLDEIRVAIDQSANPYTIVAWDFYEVDFLGRKWDRYWVRTAVDGEGQYHFAIRDMWARGGEWSDYRPMPNDDIATVMAAIRVFVENP